MFIVTQNRQKHLDFEIMISTSVQHTKQAYEKITQNLEM
jgi:hypothetical protein